MKSIGIITRIRNSFYTKCIALFLGISLLFQIVSPTVALALTSGPSQPEFSSFEPASTSDMVDLYSGDFTYNIPLLTVPGPNGGYPINISYHSGTGMDEEASWVGLGWSLNVGAINRQLRGVPDDFNGEEVTKKFHTRPDQTIGLNLGKMEDEIFGFPDSPNDPNDQEDFSVNFNRQIYFNSFRGLGYRLIASFSKNKGAIQPGLDLSLDPQQGIGISPSLELGVKEGLIKAKLATTINNRNGVVGVNFSSEAGFRKHCGKYTADTDGQMFSAGSAPLSFGVNQSVPEVSMPVSSYTIPLLFAKGSAAGFGNFESKPATVAGNRIYSGYYNQSKIKADGIVEYPAYGYINESNNDNSGMSDYTRSNFAYSKKHPNLAPSNFTYDIFNMSGQGIGGMFRPHRSDIQVLSSTPQEQLDLTTDLGFEFGKTSTTNFHVGIDIKLNFSKSTTEYWEEETADELEAGLVTTGSSDYEDSYFKIYGERGGDFYNEDHLNAWEGDEALRIKLDKQGAWLNTEFVATDEFVTSGISPSADVTLSSSTAQKKTRQKRLKVISSLTETQAVNFGFEKELEYLEDDEVTLEDKAFNRSSTGDHISEISVFQEDGMRYTYALPAYNISQVDVTTSVPDLSGATNVLTTDVADENEHEEHGFNGGRTNEILNKTILPAYVHSWMLTSVVAPDYIDLTNNGPTDDDYGYWAKFTYTKKHDHYDWRVPYQEANFNNGDLTDDYDNTAYYTYGTKEIYYIKKIETKTHVAIFYLSEREDALSAAGEFAGDTEQGSERLYKLDKISLFVKEDYDNDPGAAVPIQSVHFEYNYQLCPHVLNNSQDGVDVDGNTVTHLGEDDVNKWEGKLTLTKIYFTYQNSNRGALSPYEFGYGEVYNGIEFRPLGYDEGDIKREYNPNYDAADVDRWGNFKDNSFLYGNEYYPYVRFPYTEQLENESGGEYEYAHDVAQWSLRKIDLPTGGTINVNYESDDYAHVEDKPAMQMYDILNVGGEDFNDEGSDRTNTTPTIDELDNTTMHSGLFRVFFKLDREYASDSYPDVFWDEYVKDATKIWFKVNVDLNGSNYEEVSGYCEIANTSGSYGVVESDPGISGFDMGFISLKPVEVNNTTNAVTHPFRKAAWQYLRLNRPELMTNVAPPNGSFISMIGSVFNAVFNPLGDVLTTLVGGYYQKCNISDYADNIKLDGKSIIRLYEPSGKKYGGGARVKSLVLNDNWTEDGDNGKYGQEYFYDVNGDGTGQSSGVAYEPSVGSEESVLKQPIEYSQSTFLGTGFSLFLETPLLEQFYPGPSVGYSKVTVKSLAPTYADTDGAAIENSAAPISIYEFYTPKDFPVITDQTDMSADPAIVRPVMIPGVYSSMKFRRARSQGYSIVLNDMAGKPKSIASYKRYPETNNSQSLISKTEYVYKTEEAYSPNKINKLNNVVQVLTDENEYRTAILGQTFDMLIDLNENKDESKGGGLEMNFESATPLFAFIPIPNIELSQMSMKTSVATKVIHRSGILKETIVTTDQSKISTENLAYDINTGEPILSKVTNEFKDAVYSFSLPAYWYYDQMGGAYKNIGATFSSLSISSDGEVSGFGAEDVEDFFVVGDEVYLDPMVGSDTLWHVAEVDQSANEIILINSEGVYCAGGSTYDLIIRRSGRRNLMTAQAGNVIAKKLNDFDQSIKTSSTAFSFDQIIDANAVEYSDEWQTLCVNNSECGNNMSGNIRNPFMNGIKGSWRPKRNYKFVTERSSNFNARRDGVYLAFELFNWGNPSASDDRWISGSEITKYSPYGFELENKDALGIFSTAIYGYSHALVKAIAQNARYGEIVSEGFEDYLLNCDENYFQINSTSNIVSTQSHTGKYSYKIDSGDSVSTAGLVADLSDCDSYDNPYGDSPETEGYYEVQDCDCAGKFTLQPGKKYVISAWVKETGSSPFTTYTTPKIAFNFPGATSNYFSFTASGEIIDGWQRIYGEFTVPVGATSHNLVFKRSGSNTIYFDDVRIHPQLSNMVAYVYNKITLKLEAELDANNYATFYIYDQAGHLNKVKKETTRGIKTIKEGRISNAKSN